MYSSYYQENAKERYDEKLDIHGTSMDDLYAKMAENPGLWTMDRQLWLKVKYPDIYNYFINTIVLIIICSIHPVRTQNKS